MGSGGIAPLILNLVITWGKVASRPGLFSPEDEPRYTDWAPDEFRRQKCTDFSVAGTHA
jgi:hypothetical protein